MRILKLEAENIKCLKAIAINPDDNFVEITGKNEAGKSSVLDSIIYALAGKSKIDIEPLRQGADRGKVQLNIDKYKITRTFLKSGTSALKVEFKDEYRDIVTEIKRPQSVLQRFYNDISFDPLEFVNANTAKQRVILLKLLDLKCDNDYLSGISGVDPDGDTLESIDTHLRAVMEDRKEKKKELDRLKKQAEGVTIPEGMDGAQEVSIKDLLAEKDRMSDVQRVIEDGRRKIASRKVYIPRHKREIKAIESEIAEFKEKIAKREAKVVVMEGELKTFESELAAFETEFSNKDDVNFVEINDRIEKAEGINKIVAVIQHKKVLNDDVDRCQDAVDGFEKGIVDIREYRNKILKDAEFPVEGLGFNDDGVVTFEGIPVSQRGTSRKIAIGMSIVAARNPELRVGLIKSGNDIDDDNLKAMADWAREHDYQLWIERVANSKDGDAIYIEDGTIQEEEETASEQQGNKLDG